MTERYKAMSMRPPVTGATRLFAIIGDPIEQVRSPEVFAALLAERGVDAVMVPMRVPPAGLATALAGMRAIRNLEGMVVTVPHKIAVARVIPWHGPVAEVAGAVNALRRSADGDWEGELFDGIGFVRALHAAGRPPAGQRILIVGAGGVGGAVAAALLQERPGELVLFDIARERSRDLLARLRRAAPDLALEAAPQADPAGFDIVVNATPLGMRQGDPLPLDPGALGPATLVADVIMKPPVTPLLEAAAARGCRILEGRHMLDHQAPLIAEYFGIA